MALSWAVLQLLNTDPERAGRLFRWRDAIQIKYAAFWLSCYHEAPPNGTEDEKDAVDEALARELPALASVSYTHLDVYKRQPFPVFPEKAPSCCKGRIPAG